MLTFSNTISTIQPNMILRRVNALLLPPYLHLTHREHLFQVMLFQTQVNLTVPYFSVMMMMMYVYT